MSTSSVAIAPVRVSRGQAGGLLVSELRLVLRRRRNLVMLAALAAVPIVIGIVLRVASGGGDSIGGPDGGPPSFITQVTENGLFLGFSALVIVTPFLMPLTMSVVSGEAVAGEASQGTLRYLLTVPVSRGRVLAVKYTATVVYALVAAVVVAAVGMAAGSLLFPTGPVTLLSGTSIELSDTIVRALMMAGYGCVLMAGLAAIGLFVSTLTEVPVAAMATTAAIPVVSQILGAIPQLSGLHPWLFTDTWSAYADLLRDPIAWDTINRGLLTQGGYIAVFLSLAWARLCTRDITS